MKNDHRYVVVIPRILIIFIVILVLSTGAITLAIPPAAFCDETAENITPAGPYEDTIDLTELPPKGNPKLDSALNLLISDPNPVPPGPLVSGIFPQSTGQEVRVIVESISGQVEEAAGLAGQLGEVEGQYGDLVQLVIPISQLSTLAEMPGVRFVRQPMQPLPSVTSQGVPVINAYDWQAASYNGTGIKIGVLDVGFKDYTLRQAEGELSSNITTWWAPSIGGEGEEIHGAACAEIIYDIAPAATYYLANFATDVEYGNAVEWLISQDVDIISCSVGWPTGGPGDGTGFFCQVIDTARNAGILWAQSIGNQAQRHWQGTWSNPDADPFNNFSGSDQGNTITVNAGDPIVVGLKWDDPWYASSNDYDLLLYNSSGALVAYSITIQDGNDDPWELLGYEATYSGTYDIAIGTLGSPAAVSFHLYSFYQDFQYRTAAGSFIVPADAFSAVVAGAVDYSTPDTIESFSSRGPTDDGRIKPDLVAPDSVSTVSYGTHNFFGTSASTPHVAGAAALIKQRFPDYTPTEIQLFLEGRAADLGNAGKDNSYGSGRLDLGNSGNYTLTMAVSGSGNVIPDVGTHSYEPGTVVSVNATPVEGWQFTKWTGDVSDNYSAETIVVMDKDKVVTAYFKLLITDWSQDPNINTPISTLDSEHANPQIVSDGTGGAIIVWRDTRNLNLDIYAQRVNASGNTLWAANGSAVCDAPGHQDAPEIASDSTRGAIIIWQDYQDSQLHAQRIDNSGNALWTANGVAVSKDPAEPEIKKIVSDRSGNAFIAWQDGRGPYYSEIHVQKLDVLGNTVWTADGVFISDGGTPDIIPDGSGGAIVTWYVASGIFAQRIDASGTLLWTSNGVFIGNSIYPPQIVSDGSGGAIIIRQDYSNIYAHRIDASGNVLWNGITMGTEVNNQKRPLIASDGAEGAITVWQKGDLGELGTYAQRINASGNILWSANGVALSTLNHQDSPQVISDGAGGAIVTWQDYRSGTNFDIYAQRIDILGNVLWNADGIAISTAANSQDIPQIASDGSGGAIITWQDYRSFNYDVYAQQISSDGLLGAASLRNTLTIAINGSGTIIPSPGTYVYPLSTNVTITAVSSPNWEFVNWTGNVADPLSASTNVTMDTNKTVVANFARVNSVLRTAVSGDGSVSPAAGVYTYPLMTTVNITANAASGWRFEGWMGDVADPISSSTNVTLPWDKTVVATFSEIPHPPPSTGGGGGGGGGGSPGLTLLRDVISSDGKIAVNTVATSGNQLVRLDIKKGVTALNKAGQPLTSIRIKETTNPPSPPEGSHIIGLTYSFEPTGATFNPSVTVTFTYDPDDLPEGASEAGLAIAYYDTSTSKWVVLENIVVNQAAHTVSGDLGHLSTFAAIAYPPPPAPAPTTTTTTTTVTAPPSALFSIGALSISPESVELGQEANISVTVTNTGNAAGDHEITLNINGAIVDTKKVHLAAKAQQEVTFSLKADLPGKKIIDINGVIGGLTVLGEMAPSPQVALPAEVVQGTVATGETEEVETTLPAEQSITSGTNWMLIFGAVGAGVLVVAGCFVIYFTRWRRRDSNPNRSE